VKRTIPVILFLSSCVGGGLPERFACDPDGPNTCGEGYECQPVEGKEYKGVCVPKGQRDAFEAGFEVDAVVDGEDIQPDDAVVSEDVYEPIRDADVETQELDLPGDYGLEGLDAPEDIDGLDVPEVECTSDEDCRGIPRECEEIKCVDYRCVVAPVESGTPCKDDGNLCTTDVCDGNGMCVHNPLVCDSPPKNRCASDSILMVFNATGFCVNGECQYDSQEVHCDYGCKQMPDPDSDFCMGQDPCEGVICPPPQSPCFATGHCENGQCVYPYNDNVQCDDLNPCTLDDVCQSGVCIGTPVECFEPPPAFCDENTLVTYSLPGTCVAGECQYVEQKILCEHGCEDGRCKDQDPCEGVVCEQTENPCLASTGVCIHGQCYYDYKNGGPCDDGDKCTINETCLDGSCIPGGNVVCPDDGNVCTADFCDPQQGCVSEPLNGLQCDDNDKCTDDDTCVSGTCQGTLKVCESPPPPECASFTSKKVYRSQGHCDPDTGDCVYPYDIVPCESGKWCQSGECTTSGLVVFGSFSAASAGFFLQDGTWFFFDTGVPFEASPAVGGGFTVWASF